MKKIIFILLIVVLIAGCSTPASKKYSFNEAEIIERQELVTYTNKSSDETAKGKSASFGFKISNMLEDYEGFKTYQGSINPEGYDNNLIILVGEKEEIFSENDIVKVDGVILGEMTGTNLFGAEVGNLVIRAEKISKSDFITAMTPSIKTVEINQKKVQNNVEIGLEKIEFSDYDTRLYVKNVNNSNDKVSIYSFNVKMIINEKNYEENNIFYGQYPELVTELSPSTNTSGVVSYDVINPSEVKEIKVIVERPYSSNYDVDFEDYVFDIKI